MPQIFTQETKEDLKRFVESIKRKEIKARYKDELQKARLSILEQDINQLLKNERCKVVM